MGKKIDLTGQRFGKLVVVNEVAERDKNKKVLWSCVCDCGNRLSVISGDLKRGHTKSCGCFCPRKLELSGRRFGRLTAMKDTGKRFKTSPIWECLCDCGKKKEVTVNHLRGGVKSCGCALSENLEGKRYGRLLVISRTNKRSGTKVIWDCLCDCGTYCTVATTNLNSGNTRSCGCLRLEQVGENHPMYNSTITDEERLNRRGSHQRSWSKQVMERDNYTCQVCGDNKGGNLNAHHLNGWNAFPEQRFDLDNGVTLCNDCHKDFHSQYGYGDNTREQFDEYAASKTLVLN